MDFFSLLFGIALGVLIGFAIIIGSAFHLMQQAGRLGPHLEVISGSLPRQQAANDDAFDPLNPRGGWNPPSQGTRNAAAGLLDDGAPIPPSPESAPIPAFLKRRRCVPCYEIRRFFTKFR